MEHSKLLIIPDYVSKSVWQKC